MDLVDTPEHYAVVAEKLYNDAMYFVINVSSPNTIGLRKLQERDLLTNIIQAVQYAMEEKGGQKPLFVKISPDFEIEALDDVIDVVIQHGLTGIVASNTSARSSLKAKFGAYWEHQSGGISGDDPEFRKLSTDQIAYIFRETGGKVEIIGVGGIKNSTTALEKIRAGAKIIQVVTAIGSEGLSLAGKINIGITEFMDKEGIKNISEIIGIDA